MKNSTNSGHCVIYKQKQKKEREKNKNINKNKNEKKSLKFTECRCSTCFLLYVASVVVVFRTYFAIHQVFRNRGMERGVLEQV